MYNITGKSHENGISNEKQSREWILQKANKEENPHFLKNVKSVVALGGTTTKTDVMIIYDDDSFCSISNKNKEGKNGTFDWTNTSSKDFFKQIPSLELFRNSVNNKMLEIKNLDLKDRAAKKQMFKNFRKEEANKSLEVLSSPEIKTMLESIFNPCLEQKVMINDKINKQYCFLDFSSLRVVEILTSTENKEFFLKNKRNAKESRSIFVRFPNVIDEKTKQPVEEDLNIRLRLVTNNGDSAAIGINEGLKRNQSSSPVVKIQQEKVNDIISKKETVKMSY